MIDDRWVWLCPNPDRPYIHTVDHTMDSSKFSSTIHIASLSRLLYIYNKELTIKWGP